MTWGELTEAVYAVYDTDGAEDVFEYDVVLGTATNDLPLGSWHPVRGYTIDHSRRQIEVYS